MAHQGARGVGLLTLRSREHGRPDAVLAAVATAPGTASLLHDLPTVLAGATDATTVAGREPTAEPDLFQRHSLRQGPAGGPVQVVDAHEARGYPFHAPAVEPGGGKGAHGRAGHGKRPALEPDSDSVWAQRHHLGHSQGPDAGPAQGQGAEPQALLPQDQLGDAVLPAGGNGRAQDQGPDTGGPQGGRGPGPADDGRGAGEAARHHGAGGRTAASAPSESGAGTGFDAECERSRQDGGSSVWRRPSGAGGEHQRRRRPRHDACTSTRCRAQAARGQHDGSPEACLDHVDGRRPPCGQTAGGAGDDAAGSPGHAPGAPEAAVPTAAAADAAGEPVPATGSSAAEDAATVAAAAAEARRSRLFSHSSPADADAEATGPGFPDGSRTCCPCPCPGAVDVGLSPGAVPSSDGIYICSFGAGSGPSTSSKFDADSDPALESCSRSGLGSGLGSCSGPCSISNPRSAETNPYSGPGPAPTNTSCSSSTASTTAGPLGRS